MAAARAGLIAAGLLLVVGAGMGRCSAGEPEVVTKVVTVPTVVTHTETKKVEIAKPFPVECKQMVNLTEGVTKSASAMSADIFEADTKIDAFIESNVEPKDLQKAVDTQTQLKVLHTGIDNEVYRYLQLNDSLKRAQAACSEALDANSK